MTTELVKKDMPINNVITPIQLLNIAVQNGADIDQMKMLMELNREWEADEARKAYHQAVAQFKTESITILKNKKVTYKNQDGTETAYSHPSLDHVLEMTVPVLAKYGLSHSWATFQGEGGRITVKCILTHNQGYSEFVELSASPDDSGKKNNIQRISSSVAYLERYTFLAITGQAAKGQDDDGAGAGERMDKAAYEAGVKRGAEYGKAWIRHIDVINEVKDRLADEDYLAAAEALFSLSNKELMSINLAPTKGGIFTLKEKAAMDEEKNPAWREAKLEGIKLNPDVDRSM